MQPLTVGDESDAPRAGGFASPFPEFTRVIYQRNPLVEVVCQLRFSPILRIDTDPPAEFQDRIRSAFPSSKGAHRRPAAIASGPPTANCQFLSPDYEAETRSGL